MQFVIHGFAAKDPGQPIAHRAAADDHETARAIAAVYLDRGLTARIWQAEPEAMALALVEELEPAQ